MQTTAQPLSLERIKSAPRALLILGFVGLAALAAHIKVPVPGTVVPMTMQTAVILLAGLVLGSRDGLITAILYVLGGAAGLPFFAGAAGLAVLAGPTGGYLVGFMAAAWMVGKLQPMATTFARTWVLTFLSSLPIFLFGAIQLKIYISAATMNAATWSQVFMLGVAPFILGDVIKVTLTTTVYRLIKR